MTSTNTRAPSVGRIVHYTLTTRDESRVRTERITRYELGLPVVGFSPSSGDVLPLIVTAVDIDGVVRGQVFLDSNDVLYVAAAGYSLERDSGCWYWPVIV